MVQQLAGGIGKVGLLLVGRGSILRKIVTGSVSVNPASIAANTKGSIAVTISGLAATDFLVLQPPADLEAGLVYAGHAVTGTDTLTIYLLNPTAGAVDGAAKNWGYLWFEVGRW